MRKSRRLHGVRMEWAAFSTPQQRRSGSAPNQRSGGMPTSRREAMRSEEKKSRREISEEAARAQAGVKKLIRQSKSKMCSDYFHNLRAAKEWRAARYANPRAGMTMEALTDRADNQANTTTEKEEMPTGKSCPLNDNDQDYNLPPARSAHTRVTKQAVERALDSRSVRNAPGPDKLSFCAIQLLRRWDKEKIVRLMRTAICTGRHPPGWKWVSSVAICNPSKDDYTKLKAYRSRLLLSCMGIVVEKELAELLSEEAKRRWLLSNGQFGSRKGQSAIDASGIMVDRAHAARANGHITGVRLINIRAAFPSVTKGRLVYWMKVRQMDGDLIWWTESFLSERMVEMRIEGNNMERHPVEAGVLQGWPVSPIILSIYTSGLIKWVEEYVLAAQGLLFVDDIDWVATGSDVNQVVAIHERCAANSIEWASWQRLKFDNPKTEVALFRCRRGHKKHLQPKLTGKIPVGDGLIWFHRPAARCSTSGCMCTWRSRNITTNTSRQPGQQKLHYELSQGCMGQCQRAQGPSRCHVSKLWHSMRESSGGNPKK